MNADLQAMQEAISTIGAACTDLAAVVEGLPKFLDKQIGAFRTELATAVSTMTAQLATITADSKAVAEAVRADLGKLEGQLNLSCSMLTQQVSDVEVELRSVIGGNAKAIEALGTTLGTEQAKTEAMNRHAAELSGRVDKVAEDLEARVNDLTTATTEKFIKLEQRAVVLVDDASRVLGSDIKSITGAVSNQQRLLETMHTAMGAAEEAIENVAHDIKRVDDRELAHYSMHVDEITKLATETGAQVAEVKTNLTQRIDGTRGELIDLSKEVGQDKGTVVELRKQLTDRIDQTDVALGEVQKNVMDLNGETRELRTAVDSNKLGIEELTVAHDKSSNASRDLIALAHGGIAECKADISTLLDTTNATVERVNAQTQVVVNLGNEVKERAEVTEKALADAGKKHDSLVTTVLGNMETNLKGFADLEDSINAVSQRTSAVVIDLATVRDAAALAQKTADDRLTATTIAFNDVHKQHAVELTHLTETVTGQIERTSALVVDLTTLRGQAERDFKRVDDQHAAFVERVENTHSKIVMPALAAHEKRVDELAANHDGFVEDTKGKVLNLGIAIKAHGEGVQSVQEAMVQERTRVNGEFATYGQKLDGVSAQGKETADSLREQIGKTEDHIKSVATTAGAGLLEVKGTVLAQGRKLDDLEKLAESTDKAVAGLGTDAVNTQAKLHQTSCEVAAVREVVGMQGETLAAVHKEVEQKADTTYVQTQVKEVRGYVDVHVGKVEDLVVRTKDGWKETLAGYAGGVGAELKTLSSVVAELRETAFAAIGEEGKARQDAFALAESLVKSLGENFLKVEARMVGELTGVRDSIAAGDTAAIDKAERSAAMLVQQTATDLQADLAGLRSAVEGLPTPDALAAVETRAMARLGALADDLATLREAAPPAVDLSAVEKRMDRLSEIADELTTEIKAVDAKVPTLTLPTPEFSLRYEDGNLKVRIRTGEGESNYVEESVPVSIGVRYRGVYKTTENPVPGDLFTHKGSVWFCRSTQAGEPGKDITGWQLAVKAGGNGKDGHSVQVFAKHDEKNVYKEGDFLRMNNRLWQCAVDAPKAVPEPGDISSTPEWALIV